MEAAVAQVEAMLEQAQVPDSAVQAQITAQLDQLQAVPEFNQTVAHIFIRRTERPVEMRMAAGLLLKNNVRRQVHTMPPELQAALKAELLAGVGDADARVRQTVGTCIATFASAMGTHQEWLALWPDLVPTLSSHLGAATTPSGVEGALDCLSKICEEVPDRMVADDAKPLDVLLPQVFGLLQAEDENWRAYALGIINNFIWLDPPVLAQNMPTFLQALFALTTDSSAKVRKHVIQGINFLLDMRFNDLLPHINGVIEFVLHSMQGPDAAVALDATEFWDHVSERGASMDEQQLANDAIRPFLPRLVPVLLTGMVYDMDDAAMEFAEDDDAHVPDKEEDIAPATGRGGDQAEADDEEEEEEEDEDGGGVWNLRKASAAALDHLSKVFQQSVLDVLLPLIEQLLQADDWQRRETGPHLHRAALKPCSGQCAPDIWTTVCVQGFWRLVRLLTAAAGSWSRTCRR